MTDVRYSEVALADLDEIWEYIACELMNPDAIDRLPEYPLSGAHLNTLLEIESDYRFIIYKSYLAFYHLEGGAVCVDRVLYEGRDFAKALAIRYKVTERTVPTVTQNKEKYHGYYKACQRCECG